MRKLVFILIAFIAVITFIRAYDHSAEIVPAELASSEIQAEEIISGESSPLVVQ